jgi:TolB-like protein
VKRAILAVLSSLMLLGSSALTPHAAQAGAAQTSGNKQPVSKLRVAVANFDVGGPVTTIQRGWGQSFAETLQTQVVQSGRFEVYDRQQTAKLLNEVNFSQAGLTSDGVRKLRSQNIDYLATGTITRLSSGRVQVTFKLIDAGTARIELQLEEIAEDESGFQRIATRFVAALMARFPLRGSIIAPSGEKGQYFINLGSSSNIVVNATGKVLETITQAGRSILYPRVGFRVVQIISDDTAIIQIAAGGYAPKLNDTVQFDDAPTAASPPPPSPAAATKGTLVVRITNPDLTGATVTINGEAQDQALTSARPFQRSLEASSQTIVVSAPGYQEVTRTVEVKGGATTTINLTLVRSVATVRVGSLPAGARVLVNGREQSGNSFELPTGRQTIEITAPGFEPFRQDVTLVSGQTYNLSPTLRPSTGKLVVASSTPGATVVVDGQARGPIKDGSLELSLEPGPHEVVVRANGHVDDRRTVSVQAGQSATLTIALRRALASLSVTSEPSGATVKLNGRPLGKTPFSGSIEPGNYEVVIELEGFDSVSTKLSASLDTPRTLEATLRPNAGTLALSINPAKAVVRVNGRVVNPSERTSGLKLAPGTYTVEVSAEGFEPQRVTVAVAAGGNLQRVINLNPSTRPTPPPPPPPPGPVPPPPGPPPPSSVVASTNLFVSSDAASGTGSRTQPLGLRAALEKAKSGVTVTLTDGAYPVPDGGLSVPEGVKLIADNAGKVSLVGKGGLGVNLSDDTALEGLTISGFDVALRVAAGTVEVRGVRLEGNRRAIEVGGNASLRLTNPTITGNATGTNIAAVSVTGQGKLTVTGGMFESNASAAIRAIDDANLSVTRTVFKNNWITGAQVELGGQARASLNEITFIGGRYSIRVTSGGVTGSACQMTRLEGALLPQRLDDSANFQWNC